MESIFKKIMGWRNYLNELTEQNCTQEAFDTHWVAPLGPNASGFEHDLVQYLGNEVQVGAISSGTAAISILCTRLRYQVSSLQTSWNKYG
jgi:dTDP-4-amino-4,6-dideoxygalactose transaminase